MKMNVADKEGNIIKTYDLWKRDKKEEPLTKINYSYELLKELRDKRDKADIREVRELLSLGADPNYSLVDHTDEDKYIKDINKVDIDELDIVPKVKIRKWYTLRLAIVINRLDILEELFKYGADPNLKFDSTTAIYFLLGGPIKYREIENLKKIVDLFIKNGANVNAINDEGKTLIHQCVIASEKPFFKGHDSYLSIIPILISTGVDPYKKDKYGKMAYQYMFETQFGQSKRTHEHLSNAKEIYDMLKPPHLQEPQQKEGFFRKNIHSGT
jgi:hypothetical protein